MYLNLHIKRAISYNSDLDWFVLIARQLSIFITTLLQKIIIPPSIRPRREI